VDFESQPLTPTSSLKSVVASQSSFVEGVENVSRKPPPPPSLGSAESAKESKRRRENKKKINVRRNDERARHRDDDATISFASSRVIRTKCIRNRLPLTCR